RARPGGYTCASWFAGWSRHAATEWTRSLELLSQFLDEQRHAVLERGDHTDVGVLEDQRLGIRIDCQHRACGAHTDHVVELATGTDRDVEPGRDCAAGDADLSGVRHRSSVGHLTSASDLRAEEVA